MTHTVVIVEDEPPARAKLKRFLAEAPDFEVVAESATVEDGIAAVREAQPEVLYLDMQLGVESGFDVVDGLRGVASPLIVFTTAYSEYAVRAFEIQALDYLLKPFDRDRFLLSIERVRAALAEPDRGDAEERVRRLLAQLPGRPAAVKQIVVRSGERAFFVPVEDIERIAAAGNYVEVHVRGKTHLLRESLASFIAQLDASEFLRVHRSHVVRVGFIAELKPMFHGDYELVLKDGTTLPLTRRYKALLPDAIREWL
jgi:two-component system LytT family response regulator